MGYEIFNNTVKKRGCKITLIKSLSRVIGVMLIILIQGGS